jgi:uracil-DNA glycosylase family 4
MTATVADPPADCLRCPRLVAFREANRVEHPDFFNRPVPSFGPSDARLLVVGMAPGLRGANRTGRPFTGDYAGDLLYDTLLRFDFAEGAYDRSADDGLRLLDCRVTNAARCVPPANKLVSAEVAACRPFLATTIAGMPRLRAVLTLGTVAHGATLAALGLRRSGYAFGHGLVHALPSGLTLIGSYHCSRYNTNTGRLTTEMFHAAFATARAVLDTAPA